MSPRSPEESVAFIHRFDERVGEDGVLEVGGRLGTPLDVTVGYASVLATLKQEPVRLMHNIPVMLDASRFQLLADGQPPHRYIDSFLEETLAASGHQDLLETMSHTQRTAAYWTAVQAIATYFNPPK